MIDHNRVAVPGRVIVTCVRHGASARGVYLEIRWNGREAGGNQIDAAMGLILSPVHVRTDGIAHDESRYPCRRNGECRVWRICNSLRRSALSPSQITKTRGT